MLDGPHWAHPSRQKTQREIALFESCHFDLDARLICTEEILALRGTFYRIRLQIGQLKYLPKRKRRQEQDESSIAIRRLEEM